VGILPQLDCLVIWIGEQIFVFCMGGTPSASDARLLVLILYGFVQISISFVLRIFVDFHIYVFTACGLGFLLSRNIVPITYYGGSILPRKEILLNTIPVNTSKRIMIDIIIGILYGGIAYGIRG
jgi:hypothetical protein